MDANQFARLRGLRDRFAGVAAYPWSNVETWIAAASPFFRTALPKYRKDFEEVTDAPSWIAHVRVVSGRSRWDDRPSYDNSAQIDAEEDRDNTALANEAKVKILAWLDGLLDLHDDVSPAPVPPDPLARVSEILHRIPAVTRVLMTRRTGRPALALNDEYDVQYLLHGLLTVAFHDIRSEEWTPSYAGSNSRMDFFLKGESVVVETKYVRADHNDRKISDELLIDKARYAAHDGCKTLVCFVYDPERRLRNPVAIQNDLQSENNPHTVVIILPQ